MAQATNPNQKAIQTAQALVRWQEQATVNQFGQSKYDNLIVINGRSTIQLMGAISLMIEKFILAITNLFKKNEEDKETLDESKGHVANKIFADLNDKTLEHLNLNSNQQENLKVALLGFADKCYRGKHPNPIAQQKVMQIYNALFVTPAKKGTRERTQHKERSFTHHDSQLQGSVPKGPSSEQRPIPTSDQSSRKVASRLVASSKPRATLSESDRQFLRDMHSQFPQGFAEIALKPRVWIGGEAPCKLTELGQRRQGLGISIQNKARQLIQQAQEGTITGLSTTGQEARQQAGAAAQLGDAINGKTTRASTTPAQKPTRADVEAEVAKIKEKAKHTPDWVLGECTVIEESDGTFKIRVLQSDTPFSEPKAKLYTLEGFRRQVEILPSRTTTFRE